MTRPQPIASPGAIPLGTTARKALHPLAVITILSLIIPANWMIGSLFMTPSRTLFLITTPYLFVRWAKGDFNGRLTVDRLVVFYVFWMTVTIALHHPDKAVTFVGSNTLIILGGYLTARATIRSIEASCSRAPASRSNWCALVSPPCCRARPAMLLFSFS